MRVGRISTTCGVFAATAAMVMGFAPQASAAGHWEDPWKSYAGYRYTSSDWKGARSYMEISWNSSGNASVYGYARDTAGDGYGALAQVMYEYWNGSEWVPTQRTLAKTSGGNGSESWNYGKHAALKVRNVWLRSCLWNSAGTICEGGAH
ncbi:hypothetical protein [Streptomyces sp. CL12-4]|uniref:hypothetical protein n=1 Tax=Streptomyces sp. CL12-4 TaxID=2810306 RepID=UPI001EFB5DA3|nr:hypothetical protein [Streptomyces sp. CL12-4]MCG8971650.1 hypothetical protein [Streptomyces sp. CL12-4]